MPVIGRRPHTNSNSTHESNNSNMIEEQERPDSPRSSSSSDSSISDRCEQASSSTAVYHSADTKAGSIAPLQPIQPITSSTSAIAGTFFRRRASSASSAPQVSSQLSGKPQERSPGKHKLFSRPGKIATGLASSLTGTSPTNARPLASPSPSFYREGERSNSFDLGQSRSDASPPTQATHRHHLLLRPRKDSDPTSIHSKSTLGPSSPSFTSLKNLSVLDKGGKDSDKASDFGHDDAWPMLCMRVIPLFSGEGLRLSVEDCNKLVTAHIRKCWSERCIEVIHMDLVELLDNGFQCLETSSLSTLSDDKLFSRLVELWQFFFGTILPYLEAVFLPLRIEFQGIGSIVPAKEARGFEELLDVRRNALIAFRDKLVLANTDRLHGIFGKIQVDVSSKVAVTETASRMLQCVCVLASILSRDEKQQQMDYLAKILKQTWFRGRIGGDRRGFVSKRNVE